MLEIKKFQICCSSAISFTCYATCRTISTSYNLFINGYRISFPIKRYKTRPYYLKELGKMFKMMLKNSENRLIKSTRCKTFFTQKIIRNNVLPLSLFQQGLTELTANDIGHIAKSSIVLCLLSTITYNDSRFD